MKFLFLLLFLTCPCLSLKPDIIVKIRPAPTESRTSISTSGEDIKPLTDSERTIFNLVTETLIKAVESYTGAKPEEVFLKSPSAYPDFFNKNNVIELKRDFKIKHIKLVNVSDEIVPEAEKKYTNNGTEKETITGLDDEGYSSFKSRHHWSGEEVSAKVRYELIRPAKTDLHYEYFTDVGQDSFGSGITTITFVETTAKFELKPGQTAKFIVKATEVKTNVLVEYETSLIGDVVVKYSKKHLGQHFWAYDVNAVLSAANMSTVVKTQELVTIEYLSGFAVQVVDVATGDDIPYTDFETSFYE